MVNLHHLREGLRFARRALIRKFTPYKKYKGNHIEICEQIIEDCWNGEYFKTSSGNFNQFWTRDFGMCCESLIKLGHKDRVKKSLEYALAIFKKYNKITTQITPEGCPLDFPNYTPESTAYIVRCIRLLNDKQLIKKYKVFLNKEIMKAYKISFDTKKGIIKQNKHFSTMKDHYIRNSCMYNNTMISMLSREADKIKLNNPFKNYDFNKIHMKYFWTGDFFKDDLSQHKYVAGDANTFPFWSGNFINKKMFKSCLKNIQDNNLDKPWPLKYTRHRHKHQEMFLPELLAPNYEGTTLFMHLALCFVKTVNMFEKKQSKIYLEKIKKIIEKHKNFLEVYNPNGSVYKKMFYTADEGMLWASIYLELVK